MTEHTHAESEHSPEHVPGTYEYIEQTLYQAADRLWQPYDKLSFAYHYSAAARHQFVVLPNNHPEDADSLIIGLSEPTNRMIGALHTALPKAIVLDNILFAVHHPNYEANVEICMMHDAGAAAGYTYLLSYQQFSDLIKEGGVCDFVPPAMRLARRTLHFLEDIGRTQQALREISQPLPTLRDETTPYERGG